MGGWKVGAEGGRATHSAREGKTKEAGWWGTSSY